MSFNGIFVWDAKYGIPNSNEEEEATKFLKQLDDLPKEVNHNIHKFTKFFDAFVEEASEFYDEEPAIVDNVGISNYDKDQPVPVLYYVEGPPTEAYHHYMSALLKGAQMNNLVVYDTLSDTIDMPDSNGHANEGYANWKRHLATLKDSESTEQALGPNELPRKGYANWQRYFAKLKAQREKERALDPNELPKTYTLIKRLIAKMLKERLQQLGIKNLKSSSSDEPQCIIDLNDFKIVLTIFCTKDDIAFLEGTKKVYLYPVLYIYIKHDDELIRGPELRLDYFGFYKVPSNAESAVWECLAVETMSQLTTYIEQSIAMVSCLYSHCHSLSDLYEFLINNTDDVRLARHHYSYQKLIHIDPRFLTTLAKLTHQPNYSKLVDDYRQQYVNDKMYSMQITKGYFEEKENLLFEKLENYDKVAFIQPGQLEPELQYISEFNDYIFRVEAQLNK